MIKVWVLIVILQGGQRDAPTTFKLTYGTPQECLTESRYWTGKKFEGPRNMSTGTTVTAAVCRPETVIK